VRIETRSWTTCPWPPPGPSRSWSSATTPRSTPASYVKGAYYLEPEAVGVKPYQLLRKALEKTGKVAVGKVALRDREHLCRLALHERAILLNTSTGRTRSVTWASSPSRRRGRDPRRELEMAVMLVENLAARFDPARHRDGYRDAVEGLVEAKLNDRPLERNPVTTTRPDHRPDGRPQGVGRGVRPAAAGAGGTEASRNGPPAPPPPPRV